MSPIDFTTCTAREVIARSILCHPTLFADTLNQAAAVHTAYAYRTSDHTAALSARRLAVACADAALLDDADAICADFSMMIVAFTEACRLQCIPAHLRQDIIAR